MTTKTDTRLGVTRGWALGESGQAVADALNQNFRLFAALVQATVKSISLTTPPGSPADGDTYIVPSAATGAWAGKTNQIAVWDASLATAAWFFVVPTDGFTASLVGGSQYRFDGTNWVVSGGSGGGGSTTLNINPQTGTTYTLVAGDFPTTGDTIVEMNNAAANTLTVPPNSSVAIGIGRSIFVRQEGAGQTTVAAGAGVTINTNDSLKLRKQGAMVRLIKRATDTWELTGEAEIAALTATGQTSLGGLPGAEGLRVLNVASAVTRVEVAGSSGVNASIKAEGSGTDLNLTVAQKGAAVLTMGTTGGSAKILGTSVQLTDQGGARNYVSVYGAASGSAPRIQPGGSDTDINLDLWGIGTGNVRVQSPMTVNANMTIGGTGRRVAADFDNATHANRAAFQTSTVNAQTNVGVVPNGTSPVAGFTAFGSSSAANCSFVQMATTSTDVRIAAGAIGSGTQLPMSVQVNGAERVRIDTSGHTTPGADNTQNFGSGSLRWSTVYAGTGTINTSDGRIKTEVAPLTAAETEAAKALAVEIGTYRFLAAIADKGDAARLHAGMTVQRAIEIMEQAGLDPMAYGFICYDKWDDQFEEVEDPAGDIVKHEQRQATRVQPTESYEIEIIDGKAIRSLKIGSQDVPVFEDLPVVDEDGSPVVVHHEDEVDEDGNVVREAYDEQVTYPVPVMETIEVRYSRKLVRAAGDLYSFRPDELLMFIARGFEARLSALEGAA